MVQSAVVRSISKGEETEYRGVEDSSVTYREQNHLQLNLTKTKVVDMRRTRVLLLILWRGRSI